MRVTKIELSSNDVTVAEIGLRRPSRSDKFFAKGVYGLDADEIIPKFYGFGAQTNDKLYEASLKPREIVLRVVLNPNWTLNQRYADLRDDLYRAIASSRTGEIKLTLKDGSTSVAYLMGRIIKLEVAHTSKIPEVQLTIQCEDPILRGVSQVVLDSADLGSTQPYRVTDAISTAPHGLLMQFDIGATLASFEVKDHPTTPNWWFTLTPDGGFLAGDVIRISSVYKQKFVEYERSATVYPLANAVVSGSYWPVLFPGLNEFYTDDSTDVDLTDVTFRPAHWGV